MLAGQAFSVLSPKADAKLGLTEAESDVDPTFWDTLILKDEHKV
jgi:hypothetical protein